MKIGNLDIDKLYLGSSDDVKVYLGSTKIYPSDTPPTPTKQWVSFSAGDSIQDITDNVYGIRISIDNLTELFVGGNAILDIEFTPQSAQDTFAVIIDSANGMAYITDGTDETPLDYDFQSDFEVIFSDYGFDDGYALAFMLLDSSGDGTLLCDIQLYM